MPRPLIRTTGRTTAVDLSARIAAASGLKISTARRSSAYLQALRDLDLHGSHTALDDETLIAAVRQEFQDSWAQIPLGLVAHCYLGYPYETHMLAMDGGIVEHFERDQSLPGRLESARPYARTEQYEVIEVYPDRLVCIRSDGTAMTLEG